MRFYGGFLGDVTFQFLLLVSLQFLIFGVFERTGMINFFLMIRNSPSKVVGNIISIVFGWVKHRDKFRKCNWVDWCCYPFNVILMFFVLFSRGLVALVFSLTKFSAGVSKKIVS
uniref:Uncharacterized protein n=1 Tax=Lactuca sativa TaxID=4236 RepID=A0A9R1VIY6_LACSA|nr:hypothetical protein LSAT_V11C500291770 [Lactuca sativa]